MTTARAFWVVAPGRGAIRDEPLAPPGEEDVLVRTRASGVSAGTERLVFQGRVPPSQYETMRAPLQAGAFPAPVKYGYAAVGLVEAGAAALRDRRIFCLHPHQDRFTAPAAMAVPVPDDVPDARAVLAANMETALNALWDAAPQPGERVAVVGAGVVGLLTAYLLARHGHGPLVVDVDRERAPAASRLGLAFAAAGEVEREFDLVVHASGAPAGLVWALERLAFEGRVVELSWYGDRDVALPLGGAFHSRRLAIVSSQVGHVARPMRGRLDHRGRLERALALLADPALAGLVDTVVAFEELPGFMAELAEGRRRVLCARITYD